MTTDEPDFEPAPDDLAAPRLPARPLPVRPSDLHDPADWPQAAPAGPGAGAILHGLRRRWFAALFVGLIASALSAAAAWFYLEPKFVAAGDLFVSIRPPAILTPTPAGAGGDFDTFKRTQRELILGPYVLNAALRNQKIAQLPLLRQQDDPIAWLARQLKVDYPSNAEILRISLKGDDPEALRDIVNAVIDAYLADAHQVEQSTRLTRLDALKKAVANAETTVSDKRAALQGLLRQYGDGKILPREQADVLRQHQNLFDQLHAVALDHMRAQTARDIAQERLNKADQTLPQAADSAPDEPAQPPEVPQTPLEPAPAAGPQLDGEPADEPARRLQLDAAIDRDPTVAALRQKVIEAEAVLAEANRTANKTRNLDSIKRYESDLERARADLARHRDSLRAVLAPQVAQQLRDAYARELADAEKQLALLAAHLNGLQTQEQQLAAQVKKFGSPPVELAMLQDELRPLLDVVADLSRQLAVEQAEDTAAPQNERKYRVTRLQPASLPRYKDATSQIQGTSAAALLGLLFPIFAIAWFDARSRRVNSVDEVNHLLGMRVIGSLPMLPDPSRRLLGRLETRTAHWRVALRESIDGVRTMLLRETDLEPTRVVLVTSALSGEGKTSLATQLAVSFARARCRTVLVDFDLRRPAAHRVFSSPLGPGVCDLLRGQALLSDCVQPTRAPNLSLLPAGACDDQSLAALARPEVGELFDQLKAGFDFVIVDCSPVLPVVDALLVGRHVDAALFSVLRDVSRAPKIQAAHDRLTALGIRVLGSVVTGKEDNSYRPDYRYQAQS